MKHFLLSRLAKYRFAGMVKKSGSKAAALHMTCPNYLRASLGFCAVLLLTFGPVRVASAQHWWQQTGPGPKGAGADQKAESPKQHTGKAQLEKPTPLYTSPKSVGWWYKTPGPMGAGADQHFFFNLDSDFKWTRPHFKMAQHEKLTPLYTSPKSVGWWYKSPGPMGAGSDMHSYFYSDWKWPHM